MASFGRKRNRRGRPTTGRRLGDAITSIVLLAVLALAAAWLSQRGEEQLRGRVRVADGDSLELDGRRIRLKGIDAPELHQTCRSGGAVSDCGRQARNHLVSLIGGASVECSGSEADRYDRLLARCTAGGIELNARMVRDGWAVAYGSYVGEEQEAKAHRRGLWSTSFERPRQWRREHETGERLGVLSPDARPPGRIRQALTKLVDWLTSLLD